MNLQRFNYQPKKKVRKTFSEPLPDVPTSTPWWVILLKVIVYAIGLVLAGYGTSAVAQTFFIH